MKRTTTDKLAEALALLSADIDTVRRILGEKRQASPWPARNAALTEATQQTWSYLFNEPMPSNITVRWRPYLKRFEGQATVGAIHHGGEIELDWSCLRHLNNPLATLVHELGHSRGFYAHGVKFKRHINRWLRKLGLPQE